MLNKYLVTIQVEINAKTEEDALAYGEDIISSIDMDLLKSRIGYDEIGSVYNDGMFDIFVESMPEINIDKSMQSILANENNEE